MSGRWLRCPWNYDGRWHVRSVLTTLIPRTRWTVVQRDGRAELVIWRMWLSNSYNIASISGDLGRFDRKASR